MWKLVGSLALSLALVGCASTPERLSTLSFPATPRKGKFLEQYYRAADFDLRRYARVQVTATSTLSLLPDGLSVEHLTQYLRSETEQQLQRARILTVPETGDVLMTLTITECDTGSRAARWLAGEFGAGNTAIQVEGTLRERPDGPVLFVFAERRKGAGMLDITGGDAQALLEQDLREIAEALAKELLFGEDTGG